MVNQREKGGRYGCVGGRGFSGKRGSKDFPGEQHFPFLNNTTIFLLGKILQSFRGAEKESPGKGSKVILPFLFQGVRNQGRNSSHSKRRRRL